MTSSIAPSAAPSGTFAILNTERRAQARRERSRQRERTRSVGKTKAIKGQSASSNSEWSLVGGNLSSSSSNGAVGGCLARGQTDGNSKSISAGPNNFNNERGGMCSGDGDENKKETLMRAIGVGSATPMIPVHALPACPLAVSGSTNIPCHVSAAVKVCRQGPLKTRGPTEAPLGVAAEKKCTTQLKKQRSSTEIARAASTLRWSSGNNSTSIQATSRRRSTQELRQTRRTSMSSTTSEAPGPAGRSHQSTLSIPIKRPGSVPIQVPAAQVAADLPPRTVVDVKPCDNVSTTASLPLSAQDDVQRLPFSAHSQSDVGDTKRNLLSPLLNGIMSRLESPPNIEEDKDTLQLSQSAVFMKHYYDLVEKCRSWQRYGNAMKARADTLEVEANFARSALGQRDADIRTLELQNDALRRNVILLENELRRQENDVPAAQAHQVKPGAVAVQPASHIDAVPLPPNSMYTAIPRGGGGGRDSAAVTQSSDIRLLAPKRGEMEGTNSMRAPSPFVETYARATFEQGVLRSARNSGTTALSGPTDQENASVESPQADGIVAMFPKEASSGTATRKCGTLYGHLGTKATQSTLNHYQAPPLHQASSIRSLTAAALATIDAQGEHSKTYITAADKDQGMRSASPSSTSPRQPNQKGEEERCDFHRVPTGERQCRESMKTNLLYSDRRAISLSMVEAQAQASANASQSALSLPWDAREISRGNRCSSGQSDALTVTEDYLQDIVQQKRRLRRTSHNQQQQPHHLQARVHSASSISRSSHGSSADNPARSQSRPNSRLSNHGTARSRGRTNSLSIQDSIPISKDDIFSKSSSRLPLTDIASNTTRTASALELRTYQKEGTATNVTEGQSQGPVDVRIMVENTPPMRCTLSPQQESTLSPCDGGKDPKGAHRRLYLRLRKELSTPDSVRFERYVHRYDALEIGIDGSRGIVNRVRRLLIPQDLLKGKSTNSDKYKLRKELAREFERIVREDAIPVEQQNTSGCGADGGVVHSEPETTFDEAN